MKTSLHKLLGGQDGLMLQENVPADRLTTFGVGAPVGCLIEPLSADALLQILRQLSESGIERRVLGNGSNLVLPDETLPGVVIRLGRSFQGGGPEDGSRAEAIFPDDLLACLPRLSENQLFVPAGASLMGLSRKLSQEGRSGLEFAAGIPASLGGAVKMNAGAHGSQMSDIVAGTVLLRAGALSYVSKDMLDFRYRHSSIDPEEIVLGAILELREEDPALIQMRRQECLGYRRRTQPLQLPSSGSVFRNPHFQEPHSPDRVSAGPESSAAYLLEQAGLKGRRLGGVAYSPMHSNWLVRVADDGKAEEVRALIDLGRETVLKEFGVELTPEILTW